MASIAVPQSITAGLDQPTAAAKQPLAQSGGLANLRTPDATQSLSAEQLSELVRDRGMKIINILLSKLNIDPTSVDLPTIRSDDKHGNSYYLPAKNEIVIHSRSVNDLGTFGEEIFHWLRRQLKPPCELSYSNIELPRKELNAVEELLGFIGRKVVNDLCQGTELDSLCDREGKSTSMAELDGLAKQDAQLKFLLSKEAEAFHSNIELLGKGLCELSKSPEGELNKIGFKKLLIDTYVENSLEKISRLPDELFGINEIKKRVSHVKDFSQLLADSLNSINCGESPINKLSDLLGVAGLVGKALLVYQKKLLDTAKKESDSHDIHSPGYTVGAQIIKRFSGDKLIERVSDMFRKPSIDLYFQYIFEGPEFKRFGEFFNRIYQSIAFPRAIQRELDRLKADLVIEMASMKVGASYGHEGNETREILAKILKGL